MSAGNSRAGSVLYDWCISFSVASVQVFAQLVQLLHLEFSDHHPPPTVTRTNQCGIHELQYRTLTECMRNRLGAPTLFQKQPFE